MSNVHYRRLPTVERRLSGGRRLVQRRDADTPTQLSGSAPLIWDLLEDHDSIDGIVTVLQQQFSDSAETIEVGVRAAVDSFLHADLAAVR